MIIDTPYIVEQTADFAAVYKPPKMHSVPLAHNSGDTLIDWFANNGFLNSSLLDNGLMHRLDFDTHGLVLFAKNQKSFEFFKDLQDKGGFIKEYSAVCAVGIQFNNFTTNEKGIEKTEWISNDGFPPPPILSLPQNKPLCSTYPLIVMSYFRPYGPGRKQVRPVIEIGKKHKEVAKDKGGFYRTEIVDVSKCNESEAVFTVRIRRGFRHQIRCHLCWIGCPILGDMLYGNIITQRRKGAEEEIKVEVEEGLNLSINLALRAHALFFTDPDTGEQRECRIESYLTDK